MQKRLVFTVLLFLPLLFSCKKSINEKKQDIVIAAMTSGRWYVAEYIAGSTNVTSEFDGYEFQFHNNGTVDGIKGSSTKSGTWVGDADKFTITANFTGSGLPLSRLNGTWKWTDSDWTYVYSYYNDGTQTNYLKLRKK